MCGIAGIFNFQNSNEISSELLVKIAATLQHRGPDGFGFYKDIRIGLAHARLSIIDLKGGRQPICNEDKTIWITFNGEIFNYIELRHFLENKGHTFYTKSDTETIIHLYEEYGTECLKYLNGQFAFALWDRKKACLFIARDRVGIRPLFYTISNGSVIFSSEIKSLFINKTVPREIDPYAIDQIFTFWMTIPPRTAFKGISELPAGHFMVIENGNIETTQYWDPDFTPPCSFKPEIEYAEELRSLLIDSTQLQLRADVPVGAYLSGGIDSSAITTLIKKYTNTPLRTFSVTFQDETYDERVHQEKMILYLNTEHSNIECTYSDIGKAFPDVIWHTEKPILRTAPAPLFILSKLVRDCGYKVVLTGESADEILAGYDIFKELKARLFLDKIPGSKFRPLILKRLYPYLANSPVKSIQYAQAFFKAGATDYPSAYYSHIPRWNTTAKIKGFYSDGLKAAVAHYKSIEELSDLFSDSLYRYDELSKAQYIEIKTLLSGYLLSSQGDRMAMAHSIEGRFPFLDHRVIEFCCALPPHIRINVLKEKYILKESMKELLPMPIIQRTKQPYMAPDSRSFFAEKTLDYVEELLSEKYLQDSGYFNPKTVHALITKCKNGKVLGFKDNMAIVGILSTLLTHELFIKNFDYIALKKANNIELTNYKIKDNTTLAAHN